MRIQFFVLAASFMCMASAGWADIVYEFNVDTSTISGTSGSFDFQFNPGPLVTQAASLQILDFAADGTLGGSPILTGDVAGALPGTLTFDIGGAFNDYFEGFTFGTSLLFDVRLYGPAVNSPDGTSTSGSTFAFSMFSDAAGTVPVLTTDTVNGFAGTLDLNIGGAVSTSSPSPQTQISSVTAVPEPSSSGLLGTVILLGGLMLRFRRRRQRCQNAD